MKKLLLISIISSIVMASDVSISNSDFVPRVINFLIFAGILYYLIADAIKGFFSSRREDISNKLDEVSKRLQASKQAKKDAQLALEDAKEKAIELVEITKKECQLIAKRYEEQTEQDLKNLQKQHDDKMDVERSKVTKQVVTEVLEEILKDEATNHDKEKFIKLVAKKVA